MNIKKVSFHLVKGEVFDCKNASVTTTVYSIAHSVQPDDAYRAHSTEDTTQQSTLFSYAFVLGF